MQTLLSDSCSIAPAPVGVYARIAAFTHPLTAEQLAECLGVTPGQVYRSARNQDCPSYRIGKNVRFDPAKVCAWYAKL